MFIINFSNSVKRKIETSRKKYGIVIFRENSTKKSNFGFVPGNRIEITSNLKCRATAVNIENYYWNSLFWRILGDDLYTDL